MQEREVSSATTPLTIDELATALRLLRLESGTPSYAELAARIANARQAAGASAERSRIARTTVYDLFRDGRRRVDVELVREVLVALELESGAIEHWCARARRAVPSAPVPGPVSSPELEPELKLALPMVIPGVPVEAALEPAAPGLPSLPDLPVSPSLSAAPESTNRPLRPRRTRRRLVSLLIVCVLVNLPGHAMVAYLGLPLHLDMVGTAIAAILAGPWWGALVGVATNGVGVALSGPSSLPFALVNIAGALVWGYGVRRYGMGRSIPRFFALSTVVAVVCSCVATPILIILYGGEVGHASDGLTDNLFAIAHVQAVSVFSSNVMISLADKLISGFVALAVIESVGSSILRLSTGTDRRGDSVPSES